MNGGIAVGATNSDGTRVDTEPYTSQDVMASVCKALDISLTTTFTSNNGRPMKIANSGKIIKELFLSGNNCNLQHSAKCGDVNVSTNEGYWSTSKTSSHNPASVGYTSGPTSTSNSWKAGFDRTSSRYKYKKGFVRFVDVQVPQGATITASTLKVNFKDGEDVNYTLWL